MRCDERARGCLILGGALFLGWRSFGGGPDVLDDQQFGRLMILWLAFSAGIGILSRANWNWMVCNFRAL